MSGSPVTAGLFGKLPTTGDFVARNLALGVRAWLDPWVSRHLAPRLTAPLERDEEKGTPVFLKNHAIPQKSEQDGFPVKHHPALAFRFAGSLGPLAGLATASRDLSGRAFPLVFAAPAAPDPDDPWFDQLRALAAEAPELTADILATRLAALPAPGAPDPDPAPLRLWIPGRAALAADPAAPGTTLDALFAEAPV